MTKKTYWQFILITGIRGGTLFTARHDVNKIFSKYTYKILTYEYVLEMNVSEFQARKFVN